MAKVQQNPGPGRRSFPEGLAEACGLEWVDVHRVRVGRYEILHSVAGRELVIIILKIAHRRDVYR